MEILLNEEKEKYFLKLAQVGAKLSNHFNIETIVTQEEETKTSQLYKQLKVMQEQLTQVMCDKDKPIKTYNLDTLFPFPFDKILDMLPFPKGVELPKYDKYFRTSNPQRSFEVIWWFVYEIHAQPYISYVSIPMKSRWLSHGMVFMVSYWYQNIQ